MILSTNILVRKGTEARNPVLVVGLPGIGNVGRIVVAQIRKDYKAKRIATLYSSHLPSYTMMTRKGGIRLANNSFYLIKRKGNDIVLLTGNSQAATPEGQYEVNSKILDFFSKRFKGTFVYTIGGYLPGNPSPGKPRVFGNATDRSVRQGFKGSGVLFGESKGAIWGAAGMLVAFAKMRKLPGICLLGETTTNVDAAAAKAVSEVLSSRLKLKISTEGMDKLIKETEWAAQELAKQMQGSLQDDRDKKLSYIR